MSREPIGPKIARYVLGAILLLSGVSGFLFLFLPAPPSPPGLATAFNDVFFRSHWVQFVDGVELICGVLLIMNRYVPLALVTLAAVIANMAWFHLTMQIGGLPAPIVLFALWFAIAWPRRAAFTPLLTK